MKDTGGEEKHPIGRDKTEPNRKNKRKHTYLWRFRLSPFFSIHFVLFLFNWLVSQSRQKNVHKTGCTDGKKRPKICDRRGALGGQNEIRIRFIPLPFHGLVQNHPTPFVEAHPSPTFTIFISIPLVLGRLQIFFWPERRTLSRSFLHGGVN